jgi:hypothetical protein
MGSLAYSLGSFPQDDRVEMDDLTTRRKSGTWLLGMSG